MRYKIIISHNIAHKSFRNNCVVFVLLKMYEMLYDIIYIDGSLKFTNLIF